MVIGNNTADERLWRPVEEHCARLGFRFPHVEGITGAKAGALNWARPHLDPRTELVALVDATIGTMSLIRLATIDRAGGWAEWCQTEDSEFAIRAHAAGDSSHFVNRPHGWGIIPESLVELKKQRFRWTYGPATEFKAHARLYLRGRLGSTSRLSVAQRILHGANGLSLPMTGLGVLGLPLGAALLASMVAHGEAPAVHPGSCFRWPRSCWGSGCCAG